MSLETQENPLSEDQYPASDSMDSHFVVGDSVKISDDQESFKKLQESFGNWKNKSMARVMGKIGQVEEISPGKHIRVRIENKKWTFNPLVAAKCVVGDRKLFKVN